MYLLASNDGTILDSVAVLVTVIFDKPTDGAATDKAFVNEKLKASDVASFAALINFNVGVNVAILSFFVFNHIVNRFVIYFIGI